MVDGYTLQQQLIEKEYNEKIRTLMENHAEEKASLEKILSAQKSEIDDLKASRQTVEARNRNLLETLEGITKTRTGPNSVICSYLIEQSLNVKKLDRLLAGTSIPIQKITEVGTMELNAYINAELGTNLTLEQIEGLTTKPVVFESTQEYADLFPKYDIAIKNKKLLDAFKSAEEAPEPIRPYFASIDKEQVEKCIKDFETAKAEHAKSVELFDIIRDKATIWRNCKHATEKLGTMAWSIPLFITNYRENGVHKLEIVVPTGEPGGRIDGLLARIVQNTIGKLNPTVASEKGLTKYVAQLPADAEASITQFGTKETLCEVYKQSELAYIATLEIVDLSRSYVNIRTVAVPAEAQKVQDSAPISH
ncbi:MAG: hypothetical protein QXH80_04435, partial [Candidatus Nanoarchaeia archaeon]